jgi:AAA+ superfamily predicted ATPase
VTVDGREIARARYGESEQRIQDIFEAAEGGFSEPGRRVVLLFDDVESVLMARGSAHAKEWHFSQDSTFFHAVDQLDTSRVVLVATTNRPDLVDEAIRDRFLAYDVGTPPVAVMIAVAERLAEAQGLPEPAVAELASAVAAGAADGAVSSLRQVERLVLRSYVASLRLSAAAGGGR